LVVQDRNREGLNYCPACHQLFYVPPPPKVPPWILGAVTVLVGNLHVLARVL
jgi:hypothetical protein